MVGKEVPSATGQQQIYPVSPGVQLQCCTANRVLNSPPPERVPGGMHFADTSSHLVRPLPKVTFIDVIGDIIDIKGTSNFCKRAGKAEPIVHACRSRPTRSCMFLRLERKKEIFSYGPPPMPL